MTQSTSGIRTDKLYPYQGAKHSFLTNRWSKVTRIYAGLHCASFFLYATFGRGYAYVGFPPFFIGEVLLTGAIVTAAKSHKLQQVISTPIGLSLTVFTILQLMQTIPYVTTYGILTLRDAMLWLYSLFGIAVAALVVHLPNSTEYVISRFRSFGNWYPVCGFFSLFLGLYFTPSLPLVPGTGIPILNVRAGEFLVHLAGIAAFTMAGHFKAPIWWLTPIACGVLLAGSSNRGGFLAFLLAICVVGVLRRKVATFGWLSLSIIVIGFALTLATSIVDTHFRNSREVSIQQLVANLSSVGSEDSESNLDSTKTWRLNWWTKIVDYTFYGDYFWTGKGYGVNLAIDDGILASNSQDATPLRSPHNSHLTFLARSGVPGIVLWVVLQFAWLSTMLHRYLRALQLQDRRSEAIFSWLIAYWTAFLVNAAFDVALEGPMSAIPFWTIFGLGWGASILFEQPIGKRHAHFMGTSKVYQYRGSAHHIVG